MPATAVTGLGLVTPAGIGVEETWRVLCSGAATAATDPELAGLLVDISCRVPGFDSVALLGAGPASRLDRSAQLAIVAAREALAGAGLDWRSWDGARVGVVLGVGAGGVDTAERQLRRLVERGSGAVSPYYMPMSLPNMVAAQLGIEFGATGVNLATATACAAGATAIGLAHMLIGTGACDVVLTGGAEAAVTPMFVTGFARMKALSRRTGEPHRASRPFDVDRDGFVIGEGAAVLVLESESHARARGAEVLARVAGFGASSDAHHVSAPQPKGEGAASAIRMALASAGADASAVDHVNAHGTGTLLNDLAETQAIRAAVGGHATVTSAKGVLGHALGAAGAIEAACTVLSIKHGVVPPVGNLENPDPRIELALVAGKPHHQRIDLALSNSFGMGGQNAVLALAAP